MSVSIPPGRYPELETFLAFWEHLRGERAMPARADLDISAMKPWLGHLLLLDVLDERRFRYRIYGSKIAALLDRDLQGQEVDELPPEVRDEARRDYIQVVASRAAHFVILQRAIADGVCEFGKLTLPLSDNGETVTKLLAAIYPAHL